MRQLNSNEIDRIKVLTENSVELTLIEPTQTGLEKSIMDATGPVRTYLKEKSIHDYSLQKQGPENKILVEAYIITENKITEATASLYRPKTKKGDPRIWFRKLNAYASANDILGIICHDNKLYVFNITKLDIVKLIRQTSLNPIKELVIELGYDANKIANELLVLMKTLVSKGPIPALLKADTAVGRTLEHALGIKINSSKKPDYKGIELKSFRAKKNNRKNLFAQVPNWDLSKFKSSAEILDNLGYDRGVDFKLYCTVSTITRNSQGLQLKMDDKLNQLIENSSNENIGDFVVWGIDTLHNRLLEKHSETFWVEAETEIIDNIEHFTYKSIEHTKKPILSQFDILLDQGLITLDHLIKRSASGTVVEKGPLFKIKKSAIKLLFPPSQIYKL